MNSRKERLLAVEAQLHRIEREHAVDREVPAYVAQELDVVDLQQPVGVVGHDGVVRAVTEAEVPRERLLHVVQVVVDDLRRHQLAGFVLEGRVSHHSRAAAHQRDRAMARLLEPVQHHDLGQVTDVQAAGCRVIADIGGDDLLAEKVVQSPVVGGLVDKAALGQNAQEI